MLMVENYSSTYLYIVNQYIVCKFLIFIAGQIKQVSLPRGPTKSYPSYNRWRLGVIDMQVVIQEGK